MPQETRLYGILASAHTQGTGAQRTGADYRIQLFDKRSDGVSVPEQPGFGIGGTAPSYISSQNTAYGSRANTTVTAPGSIATNDLLVLVFLGGLTGSPPPDPTPPSGFLPHPYWSMTSVTDTGTFTVRLRVFYKFASSSEPGSYVVTHTTCSSAAWIGCYRGASLTAPFGPVSEAFIGSPDTNFSASLASTAVVQSLTVPVSNSIVLYIMHDWGEDANNLVPPVITPTLTERMDGVLQYVADGVATTQAATGLSSQAVNNHNTGSCWAAGLLTIQPDVVATAGTTYNDSGSGTTTTSGSGTESASYSDSGSGTTTDSGSSTEGASYSDSGSGTATFSGSGSEAYGIVNNDSGSGTATFSGSGTDSFAASDASSGTATSSGSGAESAVIIDVGSGTATFDGSGTESYSATYVDSQAGTVTVTGDAEESWSTFGFYDDSGSGDAIVSGAGVEAYSAADVQVGTATLSGSGVEDYHPSPGVTYNDSATGAIVMSGSGTVHGEGTILNDADAVYLGGQRAAAVYVGAVKVWP